MPKAFNMLMKNLKNTAEAKVPITDFKTPEELGKIIDFNINQEPWDDNKILNELELALQYSCKPHHPHFHNQLFAGVDKYALIGDMATTSMNGSIYTYEVSPVVTVMEVKFIEYFN